MNAPFSTRRLEPFSNHIVTEDFWQRHSLSNAMAKTCVTATRPDHGLCSSIRTGTRTKPTKHSRWLVCLRENYLNSRREKNRWNQQDRLCFRYQTFRPE